MIPPETENVPLQQTPEKKRGKATLWIALSFILSGCLLAWSFSIPFRQSQSKLTIGSAATPVDSAALAEAKKTEAEEFRAAAIALDREFLRNYREKREASIRPRSALAPREKWNRHVDAVDRQVALLGNPKEGTIEWQEKQLMAESLKDGPQ